MKILEALKIGNQTLIQNGVDESILKSRILLSFVLGVSKEYLIIHDDLQLSKEQEKQFLERNRKIIKGRANSIYNKFN